MVVLIMRSALIRLRFGEFLADNIVRFTFTYLVNSSPSDYKSFGSSEHKPHHHIKVADHGREHILII